ncbi:MAG: GNAT family N-acetyltransferase [Planctomycetaceae bacterium]
MLTKLRTLVLVVRHREFGEIIHEFRRRFWSTEVSFCLSRDLTVPFEAPRARLPFTIRELQPSDHPEILHERPRRLSMLCSHVPTCYVAVGDNGEIAYMQWLMTATSNDAIRQIFGGRVPPLDADEALLEFAYTFKAWRGKNVMPRAMALIAERAGEQGCRHVMTFVREENVPALKGCQRAGFHMYRRQAVTWRLFCRIGVKTTDFAPGTRYPFEAAAQPAKKDLSVA